MPKRRNADEPWEVRSFQDFGQVQAATAQSVELVYVDQGYTGKKTADEAAAHGIQLGVVKLASAKRGCVLLPRRWVPRYAQKSCCH